MLAEFTCPGRTVVVVKLSVGTSTAHGHTQMFEDIASENDRELKTKRKREVADNMGAIFLFVAYRCLI